MYIYISLFDGKKLLRKCKGYSVLAPMLCTIEMSYDDQEKVLVLVYLECNDFNMGTEKTKCCKES